MEQVHITRDNNGTLNGVEQTGGRVYITGPHFGSSQKDGIFSATSVQALASVFYRHEAEAMLALGKWSHLAPRIEAK